MKLKIEMNLKNICFIAIIIICIFSLSYGIYYQIFIKPNKDIAPIIPEVTNPEEKFDELFDNKINLQGYLEENFVSKSEASKELVYTAYNLNESEGDKYEIQASIPVINIENENAKNINNEIINIFYDKLVSIIENSKQENSKKTIYTVSYTAYLNENILSLAIKSNLKEGTNSQRVIVKTYTYNISSNKEMKLKEVIDIKKVDKTSVENKIKEVVQEAIQYSENLSSLGYTIYKRDIKNQMYKVENSNNYLVGENGDIYIIYAYGNLNFTSEKDVVLVR